QELRFRVTESDEALGAGVGFLQADVRPSEDLLECLLVRIELDTPVNDHFEVGPERADGAFASELEDALEEHEQPARHTADQSDPFPDAPLGKQGQLRVPV